jgi:LysM repeat protein
VVSNMHGRRNYKLSIFALVLAFIILSANLAGTALAESTLSWGSRGNEVNQLQQKLTDLGYNTYGIDGIFGKNTYSAVTSFQKARGLQADGIAGPATWAALKSGSNVYVLKSGDSLNSVAAKYGTTPQEIIRLNGLTSWVLNPGTRLVIPVSTPSRGGARYGEMADWWTVASQVFTIGTTATITDLDSGLTYRVVRKGGTNHADCQPLTAADTAKMKQAYGGSWSWTRHAILVNVNGRVFAASQNGMPHGGRSIYDNNFNGHFCIHFLNSRTHGTNRVDPAHQAAVHKAAGR